ncbi:hypothetical protein KCU73_g8301, partial [Aureobasidium melanogenum]
IGSDVFRNECLGGSTRGPSGYLLVTGVIAAFYRRIVRGGAWRVDISLAGTMKYLRSLGQYPGSSGFRCKDYKKQADLPAEYLETRETGFGRMTAVKHRAKISGCEGCLYCTSVLVFVVLELIVNWDLSQAFHIKMSIVALVFVSLHAIGHLTRSMLYASRPAQQDEVPAFLSPDAVPRPYRARRRSYEAFQLEHLLMFPISAFLMVHGTVGYLQWPMMGYFLAFLLLALSAYLEVLDKETVCITVMMPASRNFDYKAGQYVLLQVPVLSRWQRHPITIFTCIANELQLHIKTDGNWTGKHRKFEKKLEDLESGIKVGVFFCGTPFWDTNWQTRVER